MERQMISERLLTSLSIIQTRPSTGVRLRQTLNSSTSMLCLQVLSVPFFLTTAISSSVPAGERFLNLFVVTALTLVTSTALFWKSNRKYSEKLVVNMVDVAEVLESPATHRQKARMGKIVWFARMVVQVCYGGVAIFQAIYVSFPLFAGVNLGTIPFLEDSRFKFWLTYTLISLCAATSSISTASFISYYAQMCLCLMGLFDTLNENILGAKRNAELRNLIRIHQSLIRLASDLSRLLSSTCCIVVGASVTILVANTCMLFTVSRNPGLLFVIAFTVILLFIIC